LSFKVGSKLFGPAKHAIQGLVAYVTSDEKFGEIWQKVVKFGAINERIGADEAKNFTAFL